VINIPALFGGFLARLWLSMFLGIIEAFPFYLVKDFELIFAGLKWPTLSLCSRCLSLKNYLLDSRNIIVHFLCLALNVFKIFNNSHVFLVLILIIFLFLHFQRLCILQILLLLHVLKISFLLLMLVIRF